ncbi:MAG TPA: YdjY domain-containing protein [Gemmatales bacterium]|nr:YdjY domain-containing protein [Gemmatales bacterium]HMP59156.1 YdjY domain-containing protein [Gemmatales bacterium]
MTRRGRDWAGLAGCLALGLVLGGCRANPNEMEYPTATFSREEIGSTRRGIVAVRRPGEDTPPVFGGVTQTPFGPNVYLQTFRPPLVGAALQLADRLAQVAELASPLAGLSLLPHDLVTWRRWPGPDHRQVVIDAEVVFREGFLEHVLTRQESGKNHESILAASFDAEHLHLALLAAGAKPGQPARYVEEGDEPRFYPPSGDIIGVLLEYRGPSGEMRRVSAQTWVVDARNRRPLNQDWVFAGSFSGTYEDGTGAERRFYAANEGRIICVANFGSALLDLPFESKDASPQEGGLDFIANTAVIPPLGTKVSVVLVPRGRRPGPGDHPLGSMLPRPSTPAIITSSAPLPNAGDTPP